MLIRWIWRGLAVFLGRTAGEAYPRRGAAPRTPGPRLRRETRH
jgi:hypothetical protein